MAYSETLAERVRRELKAAPDVTERRMFGGLCLMVRGNMCCGIVGDELMVRVGPARYLECLAEPHARPMDFTGRPMSGMVMVSPEGIADEDGLGKWVQRGARHAASLPPRAGSRKPT